MGLVAAGFQQSRGLGAAGRQGDMLVDTDGVAGESQSFRLREILGEILGNPYLSGTPRPASLTERSV